jgi:hypothetical protein
MFPHLLLQLALADAAGTTFSVSYDAAADCPTQATFEAAILTRSPSARRVDGAADVRLEVTLQPARGERRLRVVLADGTTTDREIAEDGCTESMQSMAVIAAMVLDAQKRETAAPSPAPAPVPTPAPSPPPARAPAPPRDARPASATPHRRTWLDVAAGTTLESAVAPKLALGAALGAELGLRRSSWLAPSLRVSGVFARAPIVETEAGDARFRVVVARSQLCGLRLGQDRAGIRLCGLVDGGALLASGFNTRNERSQTMPWLAFGAALVGALKLAGPVTLELGGGARGLVVHDEFIFAPGAPVHQVPVFAWNSWLGLSYRVW